MRSNPVKKLAHFAQRGFTLVELLVSMTILTVLLLVLSEMYGEFTQAHGTVASNVEDYDDIRLLGNMFQRELRGVMVRTDQNRYMNFKVENTGDKVGMYFVAPDEQIGSTTEMSFVSHYAYVWVKKDRVLYRTVYNSKLFPEDALLTDSCTGSGIKNDNTALNVIRLKNMTLAYNSGDPYGWISSSEFEKRLEFDQQPGHELVDDVYLFEINCFDGPPSEDPEPQLTWEKSDDLPHYVEIHIGISPPQNRSVLSRELDGGEIQSRELLKNFYITVPMVARGVTTNKIFE